MFKTGAVIRWLILTAAIMLTSYLQEGIQVSGFFSALLAAAILSILNVFLRPVLLILTLPFNIFTLGLFTFVINAVLLMMVSGVVSGFTVRDFWSALFGSLLISIVSAVLGSFVADGRKTPKKDSSTIEMRRTGNNRWE
jgi:putative membrane protein